MLEIDLEIKKFLKFKNVWPKPVIVLLPTNKSLFIMTSLINLTNTLMQSVL